MLVGRNVQNEETRSVAKNDGGELLRSLDALLKEKSALEAREKTLIASLSDLVGKMGYGIVPLRAEDLSRAGNPRRGAARRPRARRTAPRVQAPRRTKRRRMTAAMRKAASERMKASWAKRRRRPKGKRGQ